MALLLALALSGQAFGAEPDLERAREALMEAETALANASRRRDRLAALGTAARAHEIALAAFRKGLRDMAQREAEIRSGLDADRARLQDLIAALQSLSRAPRSALLAYPGGPVGAARSATLMSGISPELGARLRKLRTRLDTLRTLRTAQEVARIEARGALAALQELRSETAAALRSRRTGRLVTRDELAAQATSAARLADDLAELATVLKPDNEAAPPAQSFNTARGRLALPVAGRLLRGTGGVDPWGRPGSGVILTAPSFAEVTAPWPGTVRYAGPLGHYGNVIVLEPEQGWLMVLAGLGSIDRDVGETVLTGERLGDLGGPLPANDEFLLEGATGDAQFPEKMLYLELRHGDTEIDPAEWFDPVQKRTRG